MKTAYLGLGSNLGDRQAWLAAAIDKLKSPGLCFVRCSGLYETEPMGMKDQPWFLNQVAEYKTNLFPRQLLRRIRRIENELGRKRGVRNGPRNIDIDILLYGMAIVKADELEIPHPRFRERRFVLAPLAELEPGLRDPVTGKKIKDLLAGVSSQAIRSVGP
ncbi:MAG TPA: 2-amino-4-hydroxy-6-hydroxymethyldihydropteridine diphosphokinase [Bryobacteraceae bacterium]|nr:2-amino-4-hydroxy-6-hydroxymethyldihydropteridine diphosphokinase [Bryobacteraceae bacterium]